MRSEVTWNDWLVAGSALAAGIVAGLLLRLTMRWLGKHAKRTNWSGDDVLVDALRHLVPWAATIAGAAVGAMALPLTERVRGLVNQSLTAALILFATITATRVIAALIKAYTQARTGVAGTATIFVNISRVVVIAMGVLVVLQTMGVSVAPLITALGVGGLAIALALQDTLANLFAGVHILASKTIQPGDYIQLSSGEEGYVVDINWRNTVVRNLSNNLVIIPNAQLSSANMTNYTRPEKRMTILVQAGVAYDSDLEHVERVTMEVVDEVMAQVDGGVEEHEAAVRFHTFGDSRINFTVILGAGEFSDQYRLKHEFIKRLHGRFQAEGIRIPAPARTVALHPAGLGPSAVLPHQRETSPDLPAMRPPGQS